MFFICNIRFYRILKKLLLKISGVLLLGMLSLNAQDRLTKDNNDVVTADKNHVQPKIVDKKDLVDTVLTGDIPVDEKGDPLYKILQEKDYLSCFKPLAIKEISTIYLKNDQDQVVYKIDIYGSEGECKWKRDRLLFNKNVPLAKINTIVNNFSNKLYLNTTFHLMFRVVKIRTDEQFPQQNIEVPYFVILYNNQSDKIIVRKNLSINIPLTDQKQQIIHTNPVVLELSFNDTQFINMELLSGIYFK